MAGKTKYKNQFAKEKYDRVGLMLPKGMKSELLKHISETGDKSLNAFIIKAIQSQLQTNTKKGELIITELEKLNERIEQLTELVKTGSEAIESMKTALKAAEKERDRLADQRREQEPKFERLKSHEDYSYIAIESYGVYAADDRDIGIGMDLRRFENNNYFYTHERAQEVADKINFLLKLERLHDIYCPKYVPDWDNDMIKYIVGFDSYNKKWYIGQTFVNKDVSGVYFPTKEIAQKVCNILNAEEKNKDV